MAMTCTLLSAEGGNLMPHTCMQADHNSSQNKLFELMSQMEEQESARQQDADQATADLEEAQRKLRYKACMFHVDLLYLLSPLSAIALHGFHHHQAHISV